MVHFSENDVKGKLINEASVNERRIKLLASPKSAVKRDDYGCGLSIIPPGHIHEEHAHPDSEETMYIVSGYGTGIVGGQQIELKPGDVIGIEKGEAHSFTPIGDEALKILWIYSPSGPETRFLDD